MSVAFAAHEFIIGTPADQPAPRRQAAEAPLDDRHGARRGTDRILYRIDDNFTPLAIGTLSTSLAGLPLNRTVDEAVAHIMGGFDELDLHSDVPEDLSTLVAPGPWLAVGDCSPADSSSP